MEHASKMLLLELSKLTINQKNAAEVIIYRLDVIVNLLMLFVIFYLCSKFYINIITGSAVINIFVYKRFDQKSGNRKYSCLQFV